MTVLPTSQQAIAQISQEALNTAIENSLNKHQQWMQHELSQLRQEIAQLRQDTQQLSRSLQPLPDRLTNILNHWLKQLQPTEQCFVDCAGELAAAVAAVD